MQIGRYAVRVMLTSILLLGACAEEESESLRFGLSADPVTLDPRFATDATSTRIIRLLYARMVDFDERFQPVPSLARWEVVTPRLYRFTLTNGMRRFHNGALLGAQDVKATYESVPDSATASPHRAGLDMIESISIRDERTLDFNLAHPDTFAILTTDHWAVNPQLRSLSCDPARAIALLHEAGYGPGHPVRIVYKTSSDPFRVRLATILQEQLGRVGIEADLRSYDWGTFYADVKAGRFQMYSLAWVGIKRYTVKPRGADYRT